MCVLSASAQIRVTADNFTRGDVTLKARKKTKCHELWHLVFQRCMCSSLEEHFDEVGVVKRSKVIQGTARGSQTLYELS